MRLLRSVILAVLIISCFIQISEADDEPLLQELTASFKKKSLSIGTLFQFVGDFQGERTFAGFNGFNVANFRFNVGGELDGGYGYFLQANFVRTPAFLDAKMYYRVSNRLIIDAGLFKAPFSKEFLTSAASIDFVNRAQVVSALNPGRQIGVQARGWLSEDFASYAMGAFNGNSFASNANDNNNFLVGARLALFPKLFDREDGSSNVEVGVSVARSDDRNATFGGGFVSNFQGTRSLIGGDLRVTHGDLLVAAEYLSGEFDYTVGATQNASGYHATIGYMVTLKAQVLLRLDVLKADWFANDSKQAIIGLNLWPTSVVGLQANIILPRGDTIHKPQLLVNAQVAF